MKIVRGPFLLFIITPFVVVFNILAVDKIMELGIGMFSLPDSIVHFLLIGLFGLILFFLFSITKGVFFSSGYHLVVKVIIAFVIIFIAGIPYVYSWSLRLFNALEIYHYKTNTLLESYEQTITKSEDGMIERVDFSFTIHTLLGEVDEAIVHFDNESNYVVTRMVCTPSILNREEKPINYWSWRVLSNAVSRASISSPSITTTTSNSGISAVIPFNGNYLSCKGSYMFVKPTLTKYRDDSLPIGVNPVIWLLITTERNIPLEGSLANFIFIPLVTDSRYEHVYNQSEVHLYNDFYKVDYILKDTYQ